MLKGIKLSLDKLVKEPKPTKDKPAANTGNTPPKYGK